MQNRDQILETITRYKSFGWKLRRVLATHAFAGTISRSLADEEAPVIEADFDALWFSRSSGPNRESWELRLIADSPYALFETFEPDESEEEREEFRREMEAQMREHLYPL